MRHKEPPSPKIGEFLRPWRWMIRKNRDNKKKIQQQVATIFCAMNLSILIINNLIIIIIIIWVFDRVILGGFLCRIPCRKKCFLRRTKIFDLLAWEIPIHRLPHRFHKNGVWVLLWCLRIHRTGIQERKQSFPTAKNTFTIQGQIKKNAERRNNKQKLPKYSTLGMKKNIKIPMAA